MDIETRRIADILGITSQQFDILIGIYKLDTEGKLTNPKDINEEYLRTHRKGIQHSNFFRQVKQLQDKGLITRGRRATYSLNFENVRKILSEKRENLQKELEDFDNISARAEEYFMKMAFESTRPSVHYLEHDDMYARIVKSLKDSGRVYISTDFPMIAYTSLLADGIHRKSYLDVILKRCFKKEDLEIKYLTTLDIDILFNHAFRVYADSVRACNECRIVIKQLENYVEAYDNLDIRYLKEPQGMGVLIPERNEPVEFFLFTKDEHKDVSGGIYISSSETAISAKQMFMRDFEYAERIQRKNGSKIILKLKKDFERVYGGSFEH